MGMMMGTMICIMIEPGAIQRASIGIPDTLFLMLLALVVFGPRRLPEIGRQIGKLMYEFRKVSNDFKFQMEEELRASEETTRLEKLRAMAPAPQQPVLEATAESSASFALTDGDSAEVVPVESEAVAGEVRGEPRKFPPVLPPSTGETIAAQKPFRGRVPEAAPTEATSDEAVAEPEGGALHPLVADKETEEEVHHG